MLVKITGGLNDVEESLDAEIDIPFIPRQNDIIYYKYLRYIVYQIIIDIDYDEITIWVKDYEK